MNYSPRWSVCLGVGAFFLGAAFVPSANAQLVFNLIVEDGTSQQAVDGFKQAAALWSNIFTDNMTVNLDVGFSNLGNGILGESGFTSTSANYTSVRNALVADATSANDLTAVAHLQTGVSVNRLINHTHDNPNGLGSATPYVSNTGSSDVSGIEFSSANAKALGLLTGANTAVDATIHFNSSYNFNFTHTATSLGTNGGYDFVGVAAHEIGHALGFISGVDVLDQGKNALSAGDIHATTLDLFRYSAASKAQSAIDMTAGNNTDPKYLSIDGGVTNDGAMSTGAAMGDGSQASHWAPGAGGTIGIMEPATASGQFMQISVNDIRALDVIGFNLKSTASPTPAPPALVVFGMGGMALLRRARRKQRSN